MKTIFSGQKQGRLRYGVGVSLCVLALMLGHSPAAQAQNLLEAMAQAYETHPSLEASRAELRAVDERLPQARSGYLPTLTATAEMARTHQNIRPGNTINLDTRSVGLSLIQPLYRGGATTSSMSQAENAIYAQRAQLLAVEQQVLLDVVTAYLDVLRDRAVLELNVNNERVLERQLQAGQDRFRVGEATRTDVSQSEARLAGARASRISAEGALSISRAAFMRAVGRAPEEITEPVLNIHLPETLEEIIQMSLENNPSVVRADYTERAARDDIGVRRASLRPELNLIGSLNRTWEPSAFVDQTTTLEARLQLDVPIYQAGLASSTVRAARQSADQARSQIDEVRRSVTEAAIDSWERLETARAIIRAREAEIDANEVALDGVRQEALVGSRTVLDILDAEQALLDSRVDLVTAIRDEKIAVFRVLASLGRLTVRDLGVQVEEYDFNAYHERTRRRLWGTSID